MGGKEIIFIRRKVQRKLLGKEIIVVRRKLTAVLAVLSCEGNYRAKEIIVVCRKLTAVLAVADCLGNLLLYWL